MVKDHLVWESKMFLPLHGLLFSYSSKYASSHRQDSTYHVLYYTSRGAVAEMRNGSMDPPWGIDPRTHHTMSGHSTTKLQKYQAINSISQYFKL